MSAISELSTIRRTKAKTPEEKRLARKEAGRDNKAGYLFLLPWLIGLVVITVGPMIRARGPICTRGPSTTGPTTCAVSWICVSSSTHRRSARWLPRTR